MPGTSNTPRASQASAPDSTPFVHLHVHSNFSFLDGGSRIEELVARAASLGQPALALTDHDGLYGAGGDRSARHGVSLCHCNERCILGE
jgi:DNA polymerase III alpha subunit (gram-positive type)